MSDVCLSKIVKIIITVIQITRLIIWAFLSLRKRESDCSLRKWNGRSFHSIAPARSKRRLPYALVLTAFLLYKTLSWLKFIV